MQEAKSYWLGKKEFPYTPDMEQALDPVRKLILDKAKETDQKLKQLSLKLGRNPAYLQQFVRRGIPKALPEVIRHELAGLLGVDQADLGAPAGVTPMLSPAPLTAKPIQPSIGFTVPVYGQPAGGRDGKVVFNGNKVADVLAPGSLIGVRNAYAIYVVDDSMAPRYRAGEIVWVNPNVPARPGDYVVAKLHGEDGAPPDAYIKKFLGQDARQLRLEQLRPRKVLKFPSKKVISVDKIIQGGDG